MWLSKYFLLFNIIVNGICFIISFQIVQYKCTEMKLTFVYGFFILQLCWICLLVITGHFLFLVECLGSFTYKILSSGKREILFFLFNIDIFYISLSCEISLSRDSNTLLNRLTENRHLCPIPYLRKKIFSFSLSKLWVIYIWPLLYWGFPCGSAGKESTCNARDLGSSLGWEDPLEKGKATYSSVLAWRIPRSV